MGFASEFPVWDQLTREQQERLSRCVVMRSVPQGALLHGGDVDCTGLLLVHSGQLRAYIVSEEGREITIYRLLPLDICLFSASCVMRSIQFQVSVEAERDSQLWIIPAECYRRLMDESIPTANYTNEVMASRFSQVMWLMEQIMWKSFDKRLAVFLLEEAGLEESLRLQLTHEAIGHHVGSAREVVTRMLRYFQEEGLVRLARGVVEITDEDRLRSLAGS